MHSTHNVMLFLSTASAVTVRSTIRRLREQIEGWWSLHCAEHLLLLMFGYLLNLEFLEAALCRESRFLLCDWCLGICLIYNFLKLFSKFENFGDWISMYGMVFMIHFLVGFSRCEHQKCFTLFFFFFHFWHVGNWLVETCRSKPWFTSCCHNLN